ncbi:hypothetical protein ACMHYP_23010 [Bacillus cereus]|uniref:hypothetical protein n=1 Tax=Bacillus cereus group TaxID=86661 RepID=UPI0030150797
MIQFLIAILLLVACIYFLCRGFIKRLIHSSSETKEFEQEDFEKDLADENKDDDYDILPERKISFIKNLREPNINNENIYINSKGYNEKISANNMEQNDITETINNGSNNLTEHADRKYNQPVVDIPSPENSLLNYGGSDAISGCD